MAAFIDDWRLRYPLAKQLAFLRSTRDVHRRLLAACATKSLREVEACVREEYGIARETVAPTA